MAEKNDKALVTVISGITGDQEAQMSKEIMKAKNRYAPNSRGTSSVGLISDIGSLLGKEVKKIGG